ncbi:hypothetical protein [Pseudomonas sp. F(2018)]|uniref:hypothetical protein n=1 Tax=Pseudomonas sp. F(2018) TaxID=2502240 RepID=UPI0010F7FC13|nr:hypothetical protein [Pseudomonas sp. F(2018)]
MKHFVNEGGSYLGAWDQESLLSAAAPPPGSVEVPVAPADARQVWLFPGWSAVPPTIPNAVSRRQARLALLHAGKLAAVESAIAAIADPVQQMAAQIEYENATWERANPWVDQLGQAVGLSTADIDQLFITAATL